MHLSAYITQEINRLQAFRIWWTEQNGLHPEEFPMEISENNEGLWDEMLLGFEFNPGMPQGSRLIIGLNPGGSRFEAVKCFRDYTQGWGLGLKAAVDFVDSLSVFKTYTLSIEDYKKSPAAWDRNFLFQ